VNQRRRGDLFVERRLCVGQRLPARVLMSFYVVQ